MTRVVVTGSTGFIGSALLSYLSGQGYTCKGLSRRPLCSSSPLFSQSQVDYADIDSIRSCLFGFNVLIHLGAYAHNTEPRSISSFDYIYSSLSTLRNLILVARQLSFSRFILISSISVYELSSNCLLAEHSGLSPSSPYSLSKILSEDMLRLSLDSSETDFVVFRLPLVYGPSCPGNFASLLKFVASSPINPFHALRAPRSLLAIQNLCSAIEISLTTPLVSNRLFLLSDQNDISVSDLISTLSEGTSRRSLCLVLAIPPFLLKLIFAVIGRSSSYSKLSSAVCVDSSLFSSVTSWKPPVQPRSALLALASSLNIC
jgi:nucleoside-diphosphate-sugar epimerase